MGAFGIYLRFKNYKIGFFFNFCESGSVCFAPLCFEAIDLILDGALQRNCGVILYKFKGIFSSGHI